MIKFFELLYYIVFILVVILVIAGLGKAILLVDSGSNDILLAPTEIQIDYNRPITGSFEVQGTNLYTVTGGNGVQVVLPGPLTIEAGY